MNLIVNNHKVLEIILVTFIAGMLLIPIVKKIAYHIGAIDIPNERKIHTKPKPRFGGVASFGAWVFGDILYGEITENTALSPIYYNCRLIRKEGTYP